MQLKFLYVALTRTKGKLWIVDTSERAVPLKNLWLKKRLVEVADGHVDTLQFANQTDQDWGKRGRDFLHRHHYEDAIEAFEKAGMHREARMATALDKKRQAGFIPDGEKARRRNAFKVAAARLLECADEATETDELTVMFRHAAACFVELGDHSRAAEAFERAGLFSEAAAHYFDARQLPDAVRVVLAHPPPDVRPDIETRIVNSARCSYLDSDQPNIEEARALFKTKEELEEFVDVHEFTQAQVAVLEERKDAEADAQAAGLRFRTGDVLGAINTLVSSGDPGNVKQAWDLGCQFVWPYLSFNFQAHLGDTNIQESHSDALWLSVFKRLISWPEEALDSYQHQVTSMFRALMIADLDSLRRLSSVFHEEGRTEAVVACLDYYFSTSPCIKLSSQDDALGGTSADISAFISRPNLLTLIRSTLGHHLKAKVQNELIIATGLVEHFDMDWLARLHKVINPLFYINGSQAMLDGSRIPRAKEAFSIVEQWALDVLFNLNPARSELQNAFLGNFLDATKLGLKLKDIDGLRLVERNLLKIHCVSRWRGSMRRPHPSLWFGKPGGSQYAMWPLANFLLGRGDVKQAVDVFRIVVERRLPLNYGLFCDFADRLTGTFILTRSYAFAGSLHNVTLPRTWFVNLLPEFLRFVHRNTANTSLLCHTLNKALHNMYTGMAVSEPQHFRSTTELPRHVVHDAYISRICRDLCLIAYNSVPYIRDRVYNSIASLRLLPVPSVFESHRPTLSSHEELARFSEGRASLMQLPLEYQQNTFAVSYTTPVHRVLDGRPPWTIVAWKRQLSAFNDDADKRQLDALEQRQVHAATVFQRAWRAHHRTISGYPMDVSRHSWIRICRKEARARRWFERHIFRAAYVVHLPRLLNCLEWTAKKAHDEQVRIKKVRRDTPFEDKFMLAEMLVDMKRLQRKANELKEELRPTSGFYQEAGALKRLRVMAEKVQDLVRAVAGSLEPGQKHAIENEVATATSGLEHACIEALGIVAATGVKAKRPTLNMSDLDELNSYNE
ncbi:hypothetical protein K488DRAFT_87856 [Vararia minispora EC-137]|uniref:Uncharacterized protein n=1 Tax=Vararia minispora EC-137 TaxID=1314806 RepID=A0ACB8QF73_9AGAM|nr:hypothetical protein K488DRAFT_87856 [Vararia minispora EC-137]